MNWEVGLRHVGGDRELLKELSEIFLADCPKAIVDLKAAIAAGNCEALRRTAHSMKGSIGVFGATDPMELAYRLEQLGCSGDMRGAAELCVELELAVASLVESFSCIPGARLDNGRDDRLVR